MLPTSPGIQWYVIKTQPWKFGLPEKEKWPIFSVFSSFWKMAFTCMVHQLKNTLYTSMNGEKLWNFYIYFIPLEVVSLSPKKRNFKSDVNLTIYTRETLQQIRTERWTLKVVKMPTLFCRSLNIELSFPNITSHSYIPVNGTIDHLYLLIFCLEIVLYRCEKSKNFY